MTAILTSTVSRIPFSSAAQRYVYKAGVFELKALPLVLFWSLGVIWGSNFIYMKWASDYITTSQIVLLRVFFGFVSVLVYSACKKELSTSHIRYSIHFIVMALIATVIYYYGFAKGASLLPSGIAGALSGAIPIFSFLIAMVFLPEEKPTFVRAFGIVIGFFGILLIANPFSEDLASTNTAGVIYMAMGSLSVGISFVYAKKFISPLNIPSSALTTYQLGFALVILFTFTETDGIENILQSNHVALGAVIGLGILGTGLAYVIYYYLIENLGAVTASSVTYIPPIVALAIGSILIGEEIGMLDYVAVALIFTGVIFVNKKT